MRLGGNVFYNGSNPEEYALAHVKKGYGAALCPDWISLEDLGKVAEFKAVMKEYDIRIAEVGAWCNPMHPDKAEAESKIQYMIRRLELAEELEADTCVNILGSKNPQYWAGAHKAGYSEEFFREAVEVSQRVIDAVKPTHTKLSFEMMPYHFLDCAEEYLRFLEAVDRKEAAVHLDICNTMNNPRRFYNNSEFIPHTFGLLKEQIVTLHIKDIDLRPDVSVAMFQEVLFGTGGMDCKVLMEEIAKLPEDTPAMLEHMETEEEYVKATKAACEYAEKAGMHKEGLVWKL